MKKDDNSTKKMILIITVFFTLMLSLSLISLPYINLLSMPETQQKFKTQVASFGKIGWFLVLFIQVIQIVVAFIPGEPIEILAGVLYGGFGGLFLCLLGCVVASSGVYLLSNRFGALLATKLFSKNMVEKFTFLKDAKKLEIIVFILFLIPGTPKDMLTYLVGTSPMKITHFLVLSTFARIPSIISSTFIGSTLRQGEWEIAALIFALTAILGIAGIRFQEEILHFCKKLVKK